MRYDDFTRVIRQEKSLYSYVPKTRYYVTHDGSFVWMLYSDTSQVGCRTSDVVRGMCGTQSVRVGHIAVLICRPSKQ